MGLRSMLLVWVHLHRVCGLCLSSLSSPLFASSLSLLLLLDSGGDSLVDGRVLQVHRRHEWTSKLLLGDEGVQLGLLW